MHTFDAASFELEMEMEMEFCSSSFFREQRAAADDSGMSPNENEPLLPCDMSWALDVAKHKPTNDKTLRRLAQNREAARKSRLRKKAYVEQLESSRVRLCQLEQQLLLLPSNNGAVAFDVEYGRWVDEHGRLMGDLRSALHSGAGDDQLQSLVEGVMGHYAEMFRLKAAGGKADVFHMLSGMWKTPAERCFMWLGGFRSSDLLKLLGTQVEALTEQQVMGICNLQQCSQQAEEALSQGVEALHHSLADALAHSLADHYIPQMAVAMEKLAALHTFLYQADLLRHQTLQQMHRILTTRQAAHGLLLIADYFSRLRALSSLWCARPRE